MWETEWEIVEVFEDNDSVVPRYKQVPKFKRKPTEVHFESTPMNSDDFMQKFIETPPTTTYDTNMPVYPFYTTPTGTTNACDIYYTFNSTSSSTQWR